MPWCPGCLRETESAHGQCPICGRELLPSAQTPVPAAAGVSVIERQLFLAALKEAGIPAFPRVPDSYDAIRKTFCGATLYGEEICVAASDLERALELIQSMTSSCGRRTVREMAAEIEAMPSADEVPAVQHTEETAENPLLKFFVLSALGAVAVRLLFYLASL